MKKKIALTAVMILVLTLVGYGTYAYMTATPKVARNIVTAGNVKIELNEPILPSGGLKIMPATVAKREVTVKNIGKNDCYVRVKLEAQISPSSLPSTEGKITLLFDTSDTSKWVKDSDGYWRYKEKLAPNDTTTNLLLGIQFDKSMGNEYKNAAIDINVLAQAVQADNNAFDPDKGSVLDVKGWPTTPTPTASAG